MNRERQKWSVTEEPNKTVYLGDGVYASFDGYQIWLAANDHENKVVALEPEVFDALAHFARTIWKERQL